MSYWDWLPTVISAGATIWGASQQKDAQNQAAQQATQAQDRSTELLVGAQDRATQAQLEANDAARQNLLGQQRMASPGLTAVQGIIGRGERLTPDQILALDDARRASLNALQGSSLRGSARATAATVGDVDNRMRVNMMAQNRSRSDQAAAGLAGQYFNAGKNVADMDLNRGAMISQGLMNTGTNMAQGVMNNANVNAMNTIGQSGMTGRAIGDVGAVIADYMKNETNKERDSKYESVNWNQGGSSTWRV